MNYDTCIRRPWYTPAPEGLLRFGRLPPMHPYNFQQPSMRYHETGDQMMENQHFAGTSPHDSFSTPPPPPHPKAASQSGPAKVNSKSSKRKRKIINIDADEEPSEMTAYRLSYTPEKHERLASAWLECSTDLIDGNGKKSEKFLADTSRMDDSAKAGWAKALKSMESTLFPEGDLGDSGE
ncbi:uncharacterized protein LOC123440460 [Hordeum vulgare subsp. vulgare]|uniref:uncharacterized protein LOC123440460 n=1 Tax=Hordeum vulgare subsp. vulgare TaxID=112509 RepID=UPI001D1A5AF7|nr:uncharacterized protein LOC123440460 [Hordeum vulgare subsp. vulgare]